MGGRASRWPLVRRRHLVQLECRRLSAPVSVPPLARRCISWVAAHIQPQHFAVDARPVRNEHTDADGLRVCGVWRRSRGLDQAGHAKLLWCARSSPRPSRSRPAVRCGSAIRRARVSPPEFGRVADRAPVPWPSSSATVSKPPCPASGAAARLQSTRSRGRERSMRSRGRKCWALAACSHLDCVKRPSCHLRARVRASPTRTRSGHRGVGFLN